MAAPGPAEIRRVLVLANFEKEAARTLAAELEPWLAERVDSVESEHDIRGFRALRERRGGDPARAPRPDLVVVLGGDGAMLGAVRAFAEDPVPILGINLGRVGFLAATPADRWREELERALAGAGTFEPRLRLVADWRLSEGRPLRAVALNEVALQRGSHQGMLSASLRVGGHWVSDYHADGLIVATASGSTAYSLSAGGPVLEPSVDALVVTPICSQGLANRPLVLPSAAELSIVVGASAGISTLAIDGQSYHSLRQGQLVRLRAHPVPYPLYAMEGLDPYRRLRERLGWGGTPPGTAG